MKPIHHIWLQALKPGAFNQGSTWGQSRVNLLCPTEMAVLAIEVPETCQYSAESVTLIPYLLATTAPTARARQILLATS